MILDVLKNCVVDNNTITLPNTRLNKKDYAKLKKLLILIGGKWLGGKSQFFQYLQDPTDLLQQVIDEGIVNLQQIFQSFYTPIDLCEEIINDLYYCSDFEVLEPSAGVGNLIKALLNRCDTAKIACYELQEINHMFLNKLNCNILGKDFLVDSVDNDKKYDLIIANPPFSKNADIIHIKRMYEMLKEGGQIVSLMSTGWYERKGTKVQQQFKEFIKNKSTIKLIDAGRFKESGTTVKTLLLTLTKPKECFEKLIGTITTIDNICNQISESWLRGNNSCKCYDEELKIQEKLTIEYLKLCPIGLKVEFNGIYANYEYDNYNFTSCTLLIRYINKNNNNER